MRPRVPQYLERHFRVMMSNGATADVLSEKFNVDLDYVKGRMPKRKPGRPKGSRNKGASNERDQHLQSSAGMVGREPDNESR